MVPGTISASLKLGRQCFPVKKKCMASEKKNKRKEFPVISRPFLRPKKKDDPKNKG